MTTLFDHPEFDDHRQVVFCNDDKTGLKAIIAIHNTDLGPSLGGCRMYPYATEDDAVTDVLRLSKGMTYKSAIAGLPLGGGKSIIVGDPRRDKHPELFSSMGRFVDSLGGRYIVAEDSGTSQEDMSLIRQATPYAAGVRGDPSPYTARGVFQGIKAAVRHLHGRRDLEGIRVAIQGIGNVGSSLASLLHGAGARLWISDVHEEQLTRAADELGATIVEPGLILDQDVEVFAPCAMGAVLDERAVRRLRAEIVAGAANNQLAGPDQGRLLQQRGILYAPDYVVNAGGVIAVWYEYSGGNPEALPAEVDRIYATLTEIFERSEMQREPTSDVADQMAKSRIANREADDPPGRLAISH